MSGGENSAARMLTVLAIVVVLALLVGVGMGGIRMAVPPVSCMAEAG